MAEEKTLKQKILTFVYEERGSLEGLYFERFVLGVLFYRLISEDFTAYMDENNPRDNYDCLPDGAIPDDLRDDIIRTKGYFIYPSQLFVNVFENSENNELLSYDLTKIIVKIEVSANDCPSESSVKRLFYDFYPLSERLGRTTAEKSARLAKVLKYVAELDFEGSIGTQIYLLGDVHLLKTAER